MSSFTVLLLCIQACLVQNVFSQCQIGNYGPAFASGLGSPVLTGTNGWAANGVAGPWGLASGLAYDGVANPAAVGYGAAYGGAGEGNVVVAGELPVAGNTAVAGQVPIMGAVSFGGPVAAAGTVSISGQCACGCGAPFEYLY